MKPKIVVNTESRVFTEDADERMGTDEYDYQEEIGGIESKMYSEFIGQGSEDKVQKHPLYVSSSTIGNRSSKKSNEIIVESATNLSKGTSIADQGKGQSDPQTYVNYVVNIYNEVKKDQNLKNRSFTGASENDSNAANAYQIGQEANILVFSEENIGDRYSSLPIISLNSSYTTGWNVLKELLTNEIKKMESDEKEWEKGNLKNEDGSTKEIDPEEYDEIKSILEDVAKESNSKKSIRKALIYAETKGIEVLKSILEYAASSGWSEIFYDILVDAEEDIKEEKAMTGEEKTPEKVLRLKIAGKNRKYINDAMSFMSSISSVKPLEHKGKATGFTMEFPSDGIIEQYIADVNNEKKNVSAIKKYLNRATDLTEEEKDEDMMSYALEKLVEWHYEDLIDLEAKIVSSKEESFMNSIKSMIDLDKAKEKLELDKKKRDADLTQADAEYDGLTPAKKEIKSKHLASDIQDEENWDLSSEALLKVLRIPEGEDPKVSARKIQGMLKKEKGILNKNIKTYRNTIKSSPASIVFVYCKKPSDLSQISGNSIGPVVGFSGPHYPNEDTAVYINKESEAFNKFNLGGLNKKYLSNAQSMMIGRKSDNEDKEGYNSNSGKLTRWTFEKVMSESASDIDKTLQRAEDLMGLDRKKTVDTAKVTGIQADVINPQTQRMALDTSAARSEKEKEIEDLKKDMLDLSDAKEKEELLESRINYLVEAVKEQNTIVQEAAVGADVVGPLYQSGKLEIVITPKELFRQPADSDLYYLNMYVDAQTTKVNESVVSEKSYLDSNEAMADKDLGYGADATAIDVYENLIKKLTSNAGGTLSEILYIIKDIVNHFNQEEYEKALAKAVGIDIFSDSNWMNPRSEDKDIIPYFNEIKEIKDYLDGLMRSGILGSIVNSTAGKELKRSVKSNKTKSVFEKNMLSSRMKRLVESQIKMNNIGCGISSLLTVNECKRLDYLQKRGFVKISGKIKTNHTVVPKMLKKLCENNGGQQTTDINVNIKRIGEIIKKSNENVVVCSRDRLKESLDKFTWLFEKDQLISEYQQYSGGYSVGGKPRLVINIFSSPSDSRMEDPPNFNDLGEYLKEKSRVDSNDLGLEVKNVYTMVGNKDAQASLARAGGKTSKYDLEAAEFTRDQKLQSEGLKELLIASLYPLVKITKSGYKRSGLKNLLKDTLGFGENHISPRAVKSAWSDTMDEYPNDHEMVMAAINEVQEKINDPEQREILRYLNIKPKGTISLLKGVLNLMNKYKYI